MERNQKGFSLIELIVIIAVMGVLSVTGLLSISLVIGQNIKSCASDIESYIGQTKVQAMSREDARLVISAEGDGIYANLFMGSPEPDKPNGDLIDRQKIGKKGITVSYQVDNSAPVALATFSGSPEGNDLTSDKGLILTFDRSSGAFKQLDGGGYCTAIILTNGSRTIKITLVPQTGKYYRE